MRRGGSNHRSQKRRQQLQEKRRQQPQEKRR